MQFPEQSLGLTRTTLSVAIAAVLMCSAQTGAFAQQQASGQADTEASVDEIVITGTRIRRTDFDQPNAVATLTAEDIDALGIISVADMLLQMTANVAEVSLDTNGESSFFVGATLPNLRGLNPSFGASRTLTLVDGRRMPATTNGGAVDMSMVPSVLVGRMETVTGGAGATYGSDAVAGVVNIVLNREIEGTRVSAGYYQTSEGDGDQYTFSIANGSRLLNRRGHLTVGFEHQTIDPILNCHTARDWCSRSWNWIDNGAGGGNPIDGPNDPRQWAELPPLLAPRLPGNPRFAVFENMRMLHSSTSGSLHTHPTHNPDDPDFGQFLEFTPDGRNVTLYQTSLSQQMRDYVNVLGTSPGTGQRVVGGDGWLASDGQTLRQGSERNNLYGRFIYAVNDHTSVTAELSWNRNEASTPQLSHFFHQQNVCVRTDNAFRQTEFMDEAAQEALLYRGTATQCSGFANYNYLGPPVPGTILRKNWRDQVSDARAESETDTARIVLSANGGLFGGRNWTYDAYLQFGQTDRYQAQVKNRSNRRFQMAMDSILDPVTGDPVCRVNASGAVGEANRNSWRNYFQTGFGGADAPDAAQAMETVLALAEGCVPLNPFGLAASPDAIAYAWGDLVEFTKNKQEMGSVTFSGAFWDGIGAGPFQMASGIDHRTTETDNWTGGDANPVRRIDFGTQYGDPWVGGSKTSDVFAELEFPLLRGRPGAQYMMMNVSHRRSRNESYRLSDEDDLKSVRYSDSQKVSWVYNPISWMRIRTTRSQDIRTPGTRELFYRQSVQGGGYFASQPNPWREVNPGNDQYSFIIGSNPNLRNEESITNTLGFVFTPEGWGRGLQFSIDYYKIMVKGGISYASPNDPDNEDNLPYAIFRCYQYDDPYYCALIEFGDPTPEEPDNPRSNIESYLTTQENAEPFWSRGFDISAAYNKRLPSGGSFSIRLMGTRSLEQSICIDTVRTGPFTTMCNARDNVVGQTGGVRGGGLFSNYTPTPTWSGNLFGTYRKGPFSLTGQARFIGSAVGSVFWVGPDDPRWGPDLHFTTNMNRMPSWTTWNTTLNFDFNQSRFSLDRFNELSVSLNVDNVFDKQPNFWSGGGIAGVNTRFFSGIGRAYRLNMRMGF